MSYSKIFLCGHRKCGTTLLNNLLDGHDQLAVYPTDLSILYAYFPEYIKDQYSNKEKDKRLKDVIFQNLRNTDIVKDKIDIDEFEKKFLTKLGNNYSIENVISTLDLTYRDIQNISLDSGKISILKETSVEIYAKELHKLFPSSKFVQLIRDPRDNLASLYSGIDSWYATMGDTKYTILHSLLERYGLGLKLIPYNKKAIGRNNFNVIKFENLVRRPQDTLEKLCDFIGIKFESTLLNPTVLSMPTGGNSFEGKKFTKIDSNNANNWKTRIDDFSAKVVEYYFKDYMIEHGYELAYSVDESADAAIEFYKWSNNYYHYKERFMK